MKTYRKIVNEVIGEQVGKYLELEVGGAPGFPGDKSARAVLDVLNYIVTEITSREQAEEDGFIQEMREKGVL